MAAYECRNEECTEYGIAKEMTVSLAPGEVVYCGGWVGEGADRAPCFQPCEQVADDGDPVATPA